MAQPESRSHERNHDQAQALGNKMRLFPKQQKSDSILVQQCTDWTLTPPCEPCSEQVPRISRSELSELVRKAEAGRRNGDPPFTVLNVPARI